MKRILDEMIAVANRCCGAIAGLSPPHLTLAELARECGLREDPAGYLEGDEEAVRRLLTVILHHDPVYGWEMLPLAEAARLAGQFVAALAHLAPRYLTNGQFAEVTLPFPPRVFGWPGGVWTPQTDSLIDAGVLVFTRQFSLCFWVCHDD